MARGASPMTNLTIGVLHPGEMGGSVGASARANASRVLWASEDRSAQTAERAAAAGFEQGPLEAIVVEGGTGAASALKMAYAAYTKGTSALLVSIRALAMHEGVDSALLAEWVRSQGDLGARSERAAGETARKAWRFAGEMAEIAATFDDAGLPDGFFLAAGKIYESLAGYKDAPGMLSAAEVAKALMGQRPEKF